MVFCGNSEQRWKQISFELSSLTSRNSSEEILKLVSGGYTTSFGYQNSDLSAKL
jgi:hypothetical protein